VLIYLVRHAIAEERGEAWPDDRLRPLTEDGRAKMERQVRGLVEIGVTIDEILTSPLVRTRQTADILAHGLTGKPRVREFPPLEPGRRAKEVLAALADFSRRKSLALVGHEPGLGEAAASLLGLRGSMEFKKGGVALIEAPILPPAPGSGALRWMLTPKILRRLARDAGH
jgi:phosphohistidine phosphatase